MDRPMLVHPMPSLALPMTPSHGPAAAAAAAHNMAALVLPASASAAALSSSAFGAPPQPPAVPLSLPVPLSPSVAPTATATAGAALSPSLVHRPIPIAATPRASLLGVSSLVSIPSTHSAFSTAAAHSAFSPAQSPHQPPSTSPKLAAASASPSPPAQSADQPPAICRPSSTASATDALSPSVSQKSIASTASPLSTTRHQRQSSLSSNASSASPSQHSLHRGSLSSDGGSSSDLLAMSRMESGRELPEGQEVSPVEEDEEDKPTDDSADDDESAVVSGSSAAPAGVKDEDAPAPHMTVGLSSAQLAAVHKGTSCHQCKNTKQLKKLAFCANLFNKRTKPEKRVCRKKYCETCLKKFYNDNLCDIVGKSWICASCRGVCCCAACTRVGSKKAGKMEGGSVGGAQSHSPPMSSSTVALGSAHSTPSFDKRALQMGQMDGVPVTALPVTPATVPAMLPPNAASMNLAAAANNLALRHHQAQMQAEMQHSHMLATLSPAQQQQIQQQQMLLYNQLQQQQLQQQILLNNIQQQQQIVAALQMQQQQQQQQQLPNTNGAPLMPVAPLSAPLAPAFNLSSLSLPSLPLPLSAPLPLEQDLSSSMLRHSLHDSPMMAGLGLPTHLSPSVSPSTSPSFHTRNVRPTTGKSSSPSATKRHYMHARDWPYPASSPQSSSRAVSDSNSDANSPLNTSGGGRSESHSAHSTPQSGYRAGLGGGGGGEDVRMDDGGGSGGGGSGGSAFNAFSSRKDAVFSNLHRLTQQGASK